MEGIYARESPTLGRYVRIGVVGPKLISVSFPERVETAVDSEHDLLDRMVAYLNGEPESFEDVDLGLTVSSEHRTVLQEVRSIPYGEEATVEAVTRSTAILEDVDAGRSVVRDALRENPTPLVVPDHRVRDGPSAAPEAVRTQFRSLEGL